jgi:hypothetical protein
MVTLPQELSDAVVDELRDAEADLRACALVCRAWTGRSQEHLFRSVTLSSEFTLRALDALLVTTPHIARYIHLLTLTLSGASDVWTSLAADRLLSSLAHLAHLRVAFAPTLAFGRRAADTHGLALLTRAFPTLHRLELHRAVFQTRAQHTALMAGRVHLRALAVGAEVRCWECMHYRGARFSPGGERTQLPALELVSFDCEAEGARCILEHVQSVHGLDLELLNVCASDAATTVALDVARNPGFRSERVTLDVCGQSPGLESGKSVHGPRSLSCLTRFTETDIGKLAASSASGVRRFRPRYERSKEHVQELVAALQIRAPPTMRVLQVRTSHADYSVTPARTVGFDVQVLVKSC